MTLSTVNELTMQVTCKYICKYVMQPQLNPDFFNKHFKGLFRFFVYFYICTMNVVFFLLFFLSFSNLKIRGLLLLPCAHCPVEGSKAKFYDQSQMSLLILSVVTCRITGLQ